MRILNVAKTYADFSWDHFCMGEQTFNDFKSKYLDLYQGEGGNGKGEDDKKLIDDIDFELELIHQDEINVAYILALLARMKESDPTERERRRQEIVNLLAGETNLRPKRELIQKFMEEQLPSIADVDEIPVRFDSFWAEEQNKAFKRFVDEEHLKPEKLDDIIQDYLFTNRKPRREQVIDMLAEQPKILERRTIVERIMNRLMNYVETFVENLG
jgi:type I restriction enzyme R subunit